jgi:hypothetical protein
MSAVLQSPGFITHHDLDRLAGTARTRQRWRQRGLLPDPYWVRVDRARVGLLPEFVLAPVVIAGATSTADAAILQRACRLAGEVCATESFRNIARAAREVLAEMVDERERSWDFARFVDRLSRLAGPALARWRPDLDAAEHDLAQHGLVVSCRSAEVVDIDQRACLVALAGSTTLLPFPMGKLCWQPQRGEPVVISCVEIGNRRRDFLLPPLPAAEAPGAASAASTVGGSVGAPPASPPTPAAPLSKRLAAIVRGADSLTPRFAARRSVDWREQFERGYLGTTVRVAAGARSLKGQPTEVLSRPLSRPVFR